MSFVVNTTQVVLGHLSDEVMMVHRIMEYVGPCNYLSML